MDWLSSHIGLGFFILKSVTQHLLDEDIYMMKIFIDPLLSILNKCFQNLISLGKILQGRKDSFRKYRTG